MVEILCNFSRSFEQSYIQCSCFLLTLQLFAEGYDSRLTSYNVKLLEKSLPQKIYFQALNVQSIYIMISSTYRKPAGTGASSRKRAKEKRRHTVSAYSESPNVEFNIDEFESYAISRLNGMKCPSPKITCMMKYHRLYFEHSSAQMGRETNRSRETNPTGCWSYAPSQWTSYPTPGRNITFHWPAMLLSNVESSHFIWYRFHRLLSIVFDSTISHQTISRAERRRWFLQTEKALFEARYKLAQDEDKKRVHQQLCSGFSSYQMKTKMDIINDEDVNGKSPIPRFKTGVSLNNENDILPYYMV